jgi:hypothetical protein
VEPSLNHSIVRPSLSPPPALSPLLLISIATRALPPTNRPAAKGANQRTPHRAQTRKDGVANNSTTAGTEEGVAVGMVFFFLVVRLCGAVVVSARTGCRARARAGVRAMVVFVVAVVVFTVAGVLLVLARCGMAARKRRIWWLLSA